MGLCETWLQSVISSSLVTLPGYSFRRNDSLSNARIHGVGLYMGVILRLDKPSQIILTLLE